MNLKNKKYIISAAADGIGFSTSDVNSDGRRIILTSDVMARKESKVQDIIMELFNVENEGQTELLPKVFVLKMIY